jgi:hypothetical protein
MQSSPDLEDPSNHNVNRLFRERIRDKYIVVELTYGNDEDYSFSIPFFITKYRISKR